MIFFLLSLALILTTTSAKEFDGSCPFLQLKNYSDCVNSEFFDPQNASNDFNTYQVIARMEHQHAQGLSMFYTYQKQNLLATISPITKTFAISCQNKLRPISQLNFILRFESAGLCNVMQSQYVVKAGTMNFFDLIDNKRKVDIYVTRKNDYLAIWGCAEREDLTHDLAVWILLNNTSMTISKNEELKNHLKIFLKTLNDEVRLNYSENAFKLNELNSDKNSCEIHSKIIYKQIQKDVEEMRNKILNVGMKTSEFKLTFTFAFFIIIMLVIGIFFIISVFLGNRFRNSAVGNDDQVQHPQILFVRPAPTERAIDNI